MNATSSSETPQFLNALKSETIRFDSINPWSVDLKLPKALVRPSESSEIEQTLRGAHETDLAVIPLGGRTMLDLGMPPTRYDIALDLSHLTQIVDYEPNDFTITVEAGMTLADLQRHLAMNGQFLPLDHPQFERATLGGLCAVGRGGLRRNSFGGPRDWLIGMRMVKADGATIKGGGRVVKNVSGYDLPKLFAGSLGTLGIIVELTFKLRPLPASDQIVAIAASSFDSALAAGRAASQAAPFLNGCVALSGEAAANARSLGAEMLSDQPALLLRANGLESSANEVLAQALNAARQSGLDGPELRTGAIVETWQAVTDLELHTPEHHVRLRLGLPPANLIQAQGVLNHRLPDATTWIAAADSGLLFLDVPSVDAETVKSLRNALGPLQGRLTIESAPIELKQACNVWGPSGSGARLMHSIKETFDPQAILNPGRFVDGI